MNLFEVGEKYGWLVVVAVWFLQTAYPGLFKFITRKADQERASEIEAMKTDREDRKAEREFRHEIDERNSKSYEKLADAVATLAPILAKMDEKLTTIQAVQSTQGEFVTGAVMRMSETVSRHHPERRVRKSPRAKK